MWKYATLALFCLLALTAGLVFPGVAQAPQATTADPPIQLNLANVNPSTLDPAMANTMASMPFLEQLFAGLVDVDDDTLEIVPELAETWSISDGSTVYTFTLRTGATWSDGTPITAQDARYGLLRSLEPASTGLSYILYDIKNAEAYHTAEISDPNQVGVQALDAHTLRIELEHPSAQILYILSQPAARPLPQWAIDAHGEDWTLPANIVTSGAYRLAEWVPDDHITLSKYPGYFNAAQVQIDQVNFTLTDGDSAWQLYLDGLLDTAELPADAPLDPILRQALHIQIDPCTYFFGFNVALAPFDDPLVRKAFASAVDRRGIINTTLNGSQQPALTFTPPGVFGYVDGYSEGIGYPYSPPTAQDDLAQAGYPGGQGFPAVTLTVGQGTSYEIFTQYAIDTWQSVLGVSINLQSMPWSPDYIDYLNGGNAQLWVLGWCADYPDAYNFLYDGVITRNQRFGGWEPPAYLSLLEQAARETDPAQRQALYRQAEEILVESEAIMAPIYYRSSAVAAQAYLDRTYNSFAYDIAEWHITTVSQTVDPTGAATLTSYTGDTTIQVPAGAFTETVTLIHQPTYAMPPAGDQIGVGQAFEISAVISDTGRTAGLAEGSSLTLTVNYAPEDVRVVEDGSLALYAWDGSGWVALTTLDADPAAHWIRAVADRLGVFALLGDTNRVYLPVAIR